MVLVAFAYEQQSPTAVEGIRKGWGIRSTRCIRLGGDAATWMVQAAVEVSLLLCGYCSLL